MLTAKQARRRLSYAVKLGLVKKQPCEVCGRMTGVQGHHDDYQRPLEVRWLCPKDHGPEHRGKKREKRIVWDYKTIYLGQTLTLETGETARVIQTITHDAQQWIRLQWER